MNKILAQNLLLIEGLIVKRSIGGPTLSFTYDNARPPIELSIKVGQSGQRSSHGHNLNEMDKYFEMLYTSIYQIKKQRVQSYTSLTPTLGKIWTL